MNNNTGDYEICISYPLHHGDHSQGNGPSGPQTSLSCQFQRGPSPVYQTLPLASQKTLEWDMQWGCVTSMRPALVSAPLWEPHRNCWRGWGWGWSVYPGTPGLHSWGGRDGRQPYDHNLLAQRDQLEAVRECWLYLMSVMSLFVYLLWCAHFLQKPSDFGSGYEHSLAECQYPPLAFTLSEIIVSNFPTSVKITITVAAWSQYLQEATIDWWGVNTIDMAAWNFLFGFWHDH